jgi:hypothetical protein
MTTKERARKETFRCRYCHQLVGCSEQGEIGMVSLKILRMHEKECAKNASLGFNKR